MTSEYRPRHADKLVYFGALLLTAATLLAAHAAMARDWYIDGKYGGSNSPGTYSQPFRNFYQAQSRMQGGDTVYFKPTTTYPTIYVSKSGYSGRPITISGLSSSNLSRVNGGGGAFGVWVGASYITIANFDVTAPGFHSAIHVPEGKHHVTVTHNRLHDSGGNGVDLVGTDYMTISYNTVYGNAHDTTHYVYGSGISVKGSRDIDGNTGNKIIINGNLVFANTNVSSHGLTNSDGSGIIIDNNRRTYSDNRWYRGHMLVSNNVVFGNGGRGVHLYLSDHVTVNGNTLYSNNQDWMEGNYRPGEVTGDYVSDVQVYNNILYSDGKSGRGTGMHVPVSFMYCSGTGPITVKGNLGYMPQNNPDNFFVGRNNRVGVYVSGNSWGNPKFATQTLSSYGANFRVRNGSPALNKGLSSAALATDITGTKRYLPVSIGAYENAAY